MSGERVAVVGASGFVGKHVVEAARLAGLDVIPIVRPSSNRQGLESVSDQIRVTELVDGSELRAALRGADIVVHLAALTRARSEAEFNSTNVLGLEAVLSAIEASESRPSRIVLVSSLAAAGPGTPEAPRGPSSPCEPVSAYGRSKLAAEELLRRRGGVGLSWSIVRPPIVYGPFDRDVFLLFQMARRPIVPIVGWKDRSYSTVFAPDLARAILEIARRPDAKGRTFHAASPEVVSYEGFLRAIAQASGRKIRVPRLPEWTARGLAALGTAVQPFRKRPPFITLAKLPEILAPGWVSTPLEEGLASWCATPLASGLAATHTWYRASGWLS